MYMLGVRVAALKVCLEVHWFIKFTARSFDQMYSRSLVSFSSAVSSGLILLLSVCSPPGICTHRAPHFYIIFESVYLTVNFVLKLLHFNLHFLQTTESADNVSTLE